MVIALEYLAIIADLSKTIPGGLTAQEMGEKYQASYWHNKLFNPAMPADIRILAFAPDWSSAEADPPPD